MPNGDEHCPSNGNPRSVCADSNLRDVYINIPIGDQEASDEEVVGKLNIGGKVWHGE